MLSSKRRASEKVILSPQQFLDDLQVDPEQLQAIVQPRPDNENNIAAPSSEKCQARKKKRALKGQSRDENARPGNSKHAAVEEKARKMKKKKRRMKPDASP